VGRRFAVVSAVVLASVVARAAPSAALDGMGLPVQDVRFECNAWIDEAGLRALLPLQPGVALSEEQLAASRRALEATNIFRAIDVATRVQGEAVVVTYRLERKPIISEVTVSGYDVLQWREVTRLLRLRTGSFYDPDALEAARQRVLTRYEQSGYPHAAIRTSVNESHGDVEVHFDIDEGTALRIAAVAVTGDTGLPAAELQGALRSWVGKPRRREAARDATREVLKRLRAAGFYDADVDAEWVPSDDDRGVLWLTVTAGERSELEFIGNTELCRSQTLDLMDLDRRLLITDGTWRELVRRITRAYQERGYYRAKVRLRIDEGNPRRIVFTIDAGRRYAVRAVRFWGNAHVSAKTLRAQMNTAPKRTVPWPRSGAFVPELWDDDLRRVWTYYRDQGFAAAEIVDAPVEADDASGAITATVVIDEGPETIVDALDPPDLSGLPPTAQKTAALSLAPGAPLRPADLDADTKAIKKALVSDGYSDATVEAVVTREPVRGGTEPVSVAWNIARGPRHVIGAVIVQGNVETRNETILRQLPFKRGDPLDPDLLQQGQDAVYQLGTFRSVAVRSIGPADESEDVGVEVMPRPPGAIQWGGGYNTRDGITAFGEISYDNIAHQARRLTLRGLGSVIPDDASQTQFLGQLGYRQRRIFSTPWQWNAELIGERSTKTIDQFSVERGSLGNSLSRQVLKRLQIGGELQLEYADVFNVKPQSFLSEDEGVLYTTALSPFLVYDGRNDPFAPTSGVFDTLRLRYAPPGVSTVQFGKVNAQHSEAFPLQPWLSFIYSTQIAYGGAFSGAEVLPIRERYFLGGSTTVRGFAENSLGPLDAKNNVIGGDLAMVLSLELRVPIIYQLSAALFNDNGGLFLTQCQGACRQQHQVYNDAFTIENFRHSAGPGLRYMTPVGPISLDYGFKLDRRSNCTHPEAPAQPTCTFESLGEVHFSISGTF
jgi:outer membrane protein insertion porin family